MEIRQLHNNSILKYNKLTTKTMALKRVLTGKSEIIKGVLVRATTLIEKRKCKRCGKNERRNGSAFCEECSKNNY